MIGESFLKKLSGGSNNRLFLRSHNNFRYFIKTSPIYMQIKPGESKKKLGGKKWLGKKLFSRRKKKLNYKGDRSDECEVIIGDKIQLLRGGKALRQQIPRKKEPAFRITNGFSLNCVIFNQSIIPRESTRGMNPFPALRVK